MLKVKNCAALIVCRNFFAQPLKIISMNMSLRNFCLAFCLFVSYFCPAQPVITEYFLVREPIKINLEDRKVQKNIYTKGVLDIVFYPTKLTLAITYLLSPTSNIEVLGTVRSLINLNTASINKNKSERIGNERVRE